MTSEEIKKHCFDILRQNKIMTVATSSPSGEPHSASVYYFVDDDFNFYFATGRETKKFENLKDNNKIAFSVGIGPSIVSIQGGGTAEWDFPGAGNAILPLAKAVGTSGTKYWALTKVPHAGIVLVRIKPQWLSMLNLDLAGHPEDYKEGFYKIIGE